MDSLKAISESELVRGQTDAGTRYAALPIHAGGPTPTVLLFAMSAVQSLTIESFNRTGVQLHARGWNVISIDMPCHGDDQRPGEPAEMLGWVARIAAGENIVAAFKQNVNDVVAHLIRGGVIDAKRLAASGTSRGGFMSFHAAAGSPSIRAVAALAPVADFREVSEYAGILDSRVLQSITLHSEAESLVDRWAWITIGNNDDRVGAANVVQFVNALTAANLKCRSKAGVTLRLLPTPGHTSYPEWHDDAADWISRAVDWG